MATLTSVFTSIANAIRGKNGSSETYTPEEMAEAISDIATDTTASTDDILETKTAYINGEKVTGSMTDRGAVMGIVYPPSVYYTETRIDKGYHNGSGKIRIMGIDSVTNPDEGYYGIDSSTVLEGRQGWVQGIKVTGSMSNRGAVSPSGLNCGGSYTIPAGYHNGQGVVSANSLASQTTPASGKTAVGAGQMLTGYSGWVNGSQVNGTMANNGSCGATLTRASNSKTVAAGYTSGGTISVANGVAKIGSTDKTWGNGGTVNLGFNDSLSVGAGVYYAGTIKAPNPSGTLNLSKPTDGQEANVIDCKSYASVNAFYPWQRGVERGASVPFAAATGGSDCFATYQFAYWLWSGCIITVKLDERNVALINGDVLVVHFDDGSITSYSLAGANVGYTLTITVPSGKQAAYLELYLKGTGVYKYCRMFVTNITYV